jgi:hypothetical protein
MLSTHKPETLQPPDTLRVGDVVELVRDIAGRKELRAGRRGVVVVAEGTMAWGMVSVVLGADPDRGRPWLLHPRHIQLVERAPREAQANG